ncbi:mutator protein [Hordeum vulgare]|nr:mutator protein [Hordeum vulgare]
MTVTLQDVSMITRLPIEGKPLCMSTDSEGWRHQMDALIGMSPPEPEVEDGGKKDRVPGGASFTWIAANFAHCPEDANDEVIQTYARVYMWYVISRTIFADGTGKNAPWMWLKALTVFDNKFSWGSAALAYLYRQLDDACPRDTKDGGVGGCMLLLSVWSWERLPVGRPKAATWKTWDDHRNPVRLPTWAYKWDVVSEVASDVNLLYKQYSNEMDSLTTEQPQPPEWVDTDTQLHSGLDRRRQQKIKDWDKHHKNYVIMFEQTVRAATSTQGTQPREHCPLAFNNYVRWFQESTRIEICPSAYKEDILEEPTEYDALAHGEYSRLICEGYQTYFAHVLNCVRKEVKKQADETEAILDKTPGGKKGESALRLFIKVEDEMTLKAFQHSAYMMKPKKEFKRYSPDDYAHKGKNTVAGGSRLSRMRSMDDEDDDDDELDEPEPLVRRKKLASKRGRGPKM